MEPCRGSGGSAPQSSRDLTFFNIEDGRSVIPLHCTSIRLVGRSPIQGSGQSTYRNCRYLVIVNVEDKLYTIIKLAGVPGEVPSLEALEI